jgi:RNA polymerase sigma factor (TIGR02999 family)
MSLLSFARAVPGLAAPAAAHFFAIRFLKRNPDEKGGIAGRENFQ